MSLLSDVANNVQFPGSLKLLLADHEARIVQSGTLSALIDLAASDMRIAHLQDRVAELAARVALLEVVPKEAPKGK